MQTQCPECNLMFTPENLQNELDAALMVISNLKAENARYREALEFTLKAAEYLFQPDKPIHKGLDPTFYHTLTYEGDMELVEKTKKAREALKGDITPKKGEEESQWMTKDEFNMHFKMMYSEERMKNYKVWNHRTGEYESCNIFEDLNTAKIAPIEKDKKE